MGEREGIDITSADMVEEYHLEPSKIQEYFTGTQVFITGATGFLGKLLMEKLLRTCCEIEKVYILIREKKGKSIEKRLEELLENVVFDRLKREQPKFQLKIELVSGDCIYPELGLSVENKEKLLKNVNCVFHCAATVRFDEKIRSASFINVRATRDLLNLSRQMANLKSFVYISTAFSHCIRQDIDEEFYNTPITGEKLLTLVDTCNDDFLEKVTPTLIAQWPNTYAFTKAIAEEVIQSGSSGLPVAVVRPSIVVATTREPVAGWIDNMYGATGITVGAALGLIRTLHCKLDCLADIVPADLVINCAIAASWSVGNKESNTNNEVTKEQKDIAIFNNVSSTQNPLTWRKFMKYAEIHLKQVPSPLQVWHYFFILNSSYFMHLLCVFLFHRIPAYIVDFLALCVGKEPLLVKGYKKIEKFLDVIAYFSSKQWYFTNKNTQDLYQKLNSFDKEMFGFDMKEFEWDPYFHTFARGGRVYLLKDSLDTLPQGRIKYLKLQIAHYTLVGVLCLGVLWLIYYFVLKRFI